MSASVSVRFYVRARGLGRELPDLPSEARLGGVHGDLRMQECEGMRGAAEREGRQVVVLGMVAQVPVEPCDPQLDLPWHPAVFSSPWIHSFHAWIPNARVHVYM